MLYSQVRNILTELVLLTREFVFSGREPEGIWNLLSIVREMLKRRDSNAVLLLDIVTEQCLTFEQVNPPYSFQYLFINN